MEKETLLKKVKNFLIELTGVEPEVLDTKLEDQLLADGQTTIQADMFEPGQNVFIVVPDSIVDALPTEENPAEAETEVPVEAEKTPEQAKVKKIVRSQVEEQHFSALEEKIAELEAKILELSKVAEEVVVELAEEPKPIQFNPENSQTIEHIDLTPGKARGMRDSILETIYK